MMNTKKTTVIAVIAITIITGLALATLGGSDPSDNNLSLIHI